MTKPARVLYGQQVHFLRRRISYNTTGVTTGVRFKNALPANCIITDILVRVGTAFNAGTTNVLTVGQNSSTYNDMVNAGDVDETAIASTRVTRGVGLSLTADVDVYVMYVQTGTAATAGAAEIIIAYVPDTDG